MRTCEHRIEVPRGTCGQPATKIMAVWPEDDARLTADMRNVCDQHGRALLSTGNAATFARREPGKAACLFADTGNGPCGGPTNGFYCWDHKHLR